MVRRIIKEKKLTNGEILEVLSKEKEVGEFQQRVLDYVKKTTKVNGEKGRKLIEKLLKIGDISEDEAVQIVNIYPETKEELKTIFYHRKTILMEDFLNKILDVLHSQ